MTDETGRLMVGMVIQYAESRAREFLAENAPDIEALGPEMAPLLSSAFTAGYAMAWRDGQRGDLHERLEDFHGEATG